MLFQIVAQLRITIKGFQMFKSTALSLFVAVQIFSASPAHADGMKGVADTHAQHDMGGANVQIHKGHGVVNKIDGSTGKVNITHDAIASLKWSKMTMDFMVMDKAGLAALKPGMVVDFDIAMRGRSYHISRILPAK